jgi:alkylated DNA repair dioxygenase AlkB
MPLKSWPLILRTIQRLVEDISKEKFNAVLCNLYHDGREGMGYHSDEESIGPYSAIASVSFGAERVFRFKEKKSSSSSSSSPISIVLACGSLLLMKGETQRHWQHSLPKATRITQPRINLTFRQMKSAALPISSNAS